MNFSRHRTVDYKSCNLENRSFIYDEYSYTIRWQSWFTNVQPDSVLRAKTSIWNLKMPVSREISAAEAGKSAALPFLPDVGTRQSPETVLTLIYAAAPGQDGRILLYSQPQHSHN